jgi:hypothetical protein
MDILLEPGDIFLSRGSGFLSKAIRYFTRSIGEKRTKVRLCAINFGLNMAHPKKI